MPRQKRTGTGTGIDERQRSEIIKWLRVAEDAFGEVARVFDDMLSKGEGLEPGPECDSQTSPHRQKCP